MTKATPRHELKCDISYGEYLILRSRLAAVMRLDDNADADGRYKITSLYFDNYRDKALAEKVNGIAYRDKYRIRYYKDNKSQLTLERKSKQKNLCIKCGCGISDEEYDNLMKGEIEWIKARAEKISDEKEFWYDFYDAFVVDLIRPKSIISYDREAYIYEPGNVRVTFDMNVRTQAYNNDLRTSNLEIPVNGNRIILEIKYDEFIPEIILMMLQLGKIRVGCYSKYVAGRRL